VQGMKTADINRFLVVCAVVSDLSCPGYNPRQSLEKSSNLARTAVRYKVDSAKISAAVRQELSNNQRSKRNVKIPREATDTEGKALARKPRS